MFLFPFLRPPKAAGLPAPGTGPGAGTGLAKTQAKAGRAARPAVRTATVTLELSTGPVAVLMRTNARARRYTLRLAPRTGQPVATVPKGGSFREAAAFIARHKDWLETHLAARPAPQVLAAGGVIFLRGVAVAVRHDPAARRTTAGQDAEGGTFITVGGAGEHMPRRLKDFLVREARADLSAAVALHAGRLGVSPTAIRLRDTVSRWGSANSRGELMFCWRLVMAPPYVLDYVAAHEVAHLREMNHSPRFWAQVAATYGDYEPARHWLKAHGSSLQAVLQREA